MTKQIERALIAVDYRGIPLIVATDGATIHFFMQEDGNNAKEIGLFTYKELKIQFDEEKRRGLFLWEGTSETKNVAFYLDPPEYEVVFTGTIRRVESHEIDELFKLTPPEELEDDRETPTL